MDTSYGKGVVFDRVFFEAILKEAIKEGFIKNYPYRPKFDSQVVTQGRTKEALQMLLLYGTIHYPDLYLTNFFQPPLWDLYIDLIENNELGELIEIPPLPTESFNKNLYLVDFIKDSLAIKELLISNKKRAKRCFDPYNIFNLNYSQEYCSQRFDAMLRIIKIIHEKENCNNVVDLAQSLSGYDDLKMRLRYGYDLARSEELDSLCSNFDNNVNIFVATVLGTENELRHLKILLEFSAEYSLPALTDSISVTRSSMEDIRGLENIKNCEYNQIALGIFFEDELRPVLPTISSIKDVIRLREDKRIVDFRNKILEWDSELKTGEINLYDMKKEMMDANKAIKSIGKCERVGTWITVTSLPISVALAIFGMPFGSTIGIATSLASFGVACTSELLKRNYNWYLFGTR